MSKYRTAYQRGFTLIELMIVIVIVVILLATIIPAIKRYQDRNRSQKAATTSYAGVVITAERSGLKHAEVVGMQHHVTYAQQLGCWATNDVAYTVEGIDGKEQRVRMTICCRPGPVCALPPRLSVPPAER